MASLLQFEQLFKKKCYDAGEPMAPTSRKSAARRVAILRSAAASFRRRGYHGARVEEIARALRMTKGSLYYYFRDKEAILFACHDYSLGLALNLLDEVRRARVEPDEQLRRLLDGFVRLITDELHGTALTLEIDALSRAHRRQVVARRDRFDRGLRRMLGDGMRAGVFARGDAKLLAFAVMGAVNWIARWYRPTGAARSDEIARLFANYLVAGLRAPSPPATRPRSVVTTPSAPASARAPRRRAAPRARAGERAFR